MLQKFIPQIIIVFLTIITWHKLLVQLPMGEGYYYFDRTQDFINQQGKLADTSEADLFSKLLFDILPPIFGDNLMLYMAFQLLSMILLNITIFYVVKELTKNFWVSFSSAVIFLSSYIANFEMLGTGQYQRFVQRIIVLPTLLLSFIFLSKFLETSKLKFYFFSIFIFSLTVFLGHFATFLLPLFVIYPILFKLFSKRNLKNVSEGVLISLPYIIINQLLIINDHLRPTAGIFEFIQTRGIESIFEDIILQLSNMLIPPFIIEKIAAISNPYTVTLLILTLPFIAVSLIPLFQFKKAHPIRLIYLTSLLIIPIFLFLNLYLGKVDPKYNMQGYTYYFTPNYYTDKIDFSGVKGDRYYLVPYIFIAVIFSSLIWLIFQKKKKTYTVIILSILFLHFVYNTKLIYSSFDKLQPISDVMKNYIAYTKSISNHFGNNTVIIAPRPILWPSSFIRLLYGNPEMKFYLTNDNWQFLVTNKKVFIFDYDYEKNQVINLTDKNHEPEH